MKIYEIDFGGNVRALAEISGDKIRVTNAIDGWGNVIDVGYISITDITKGEPTK